MSLRTQLAAERLVADGTAGLASRAGYATSNTHSRRTAAVQEQSRPGISIGIARSEGVALVLHGVKVGGDTRSGNCKGAAPPHQQDRPDGQQPMDTSEATVQQEPKKKQPSARSMRRRS